MQDKTFEGRISRVVFDDALHNPSTCVAPSPHPAGLLIAIPLYKAPGLIAGLFAALAAIADEIAALSATVLLINDSPNYAPLVAELEERLPMLCERIPVVLLTNPENLGFVRTANRAFSFAIERGHDIILLNSDALPTPNAFTEMATVARLDPMIGFVSPRSNNASICNSPWPDHFRGRDLPQSLRDHQTIAPLLPRYTLTPTAVGFCLYVRHLMLVEFGGFDEVYGGGYNEENDLIRRCNQRGFRSALANHAFVYHIGSASFVHSSVSAYERELVNGVLLRERYPEYDLACHRYFNGAGHRAERLLSGLIPTNEGKLRVLFHCELLKASFNGTFELARKLISAFAERHAGLYDIAIYSAEDAFLFHGMDAIPSVRLCGDYELRHMPFAIAFRLAQPFTLEDVASLPALAPITGSLMLDTIALDCQQIDPHDLDMLWRLMAETSDIIGYISEFSRDQFKRRIEVTDHVVEFVALCSTDIDEYAHGACEPVNQTSSTGPILLVGNHYPHKHIRETLAALRRIAPDRRITLLGVEADGSEYLTSHVAGLLPQTLVDSLYAEADVVLFPSHYEGFGLPIMHALARGKRVVARDVPPAREIRDRTTLGDNIHLATTTKQLVALALAPPDWQPTRSHPAKPIQSWNDAADTLANAFERAVAQVSYDRCRTHQGRISSQRAQRPDARLAQTEARALAAEDLLTLLNRGRTMIGNDLVDVLDLCVIHGDARTTDRTASASIVDPLPESGAATIVSLVLTDADSDCSFDILEDRIFRWAPHLVQGGTLHLDLAACTLADSVFPDSSPLSVARAMLANAGFAPLSFDEHDGRLVADAIRIGDWRAILPGPDPDGLFIRLMYRHVLGRDPDPSGEAMFMSLLAHDGDRESALRSIYRSAERRSYVHSRVSLSHR